MLKVFISYASEDRDLVLPYYDLLQADGIGAWMDTKNIHPGQNWELEITRAFKDAHIILLFCSSRSVNKRGFVRREANEAIENLKYLKPDDIYLIPVLLEPCELPPELSARLQYVRLDVSDGWDRVRRAIQLAAEQRSIDLKIGTVSGP